ncbi:MAG: hypothetical protein LBB74_08505 [Chitinispirillales bacterium]|jgi:hypothetical protein|nr:hypothetical protein [Chitinispirillales bacterium]
MKKVLAIIAVAMCVSVMAGCTTMTTIGGVAGGHGLIGGFGAAGSASEGAGAIGSYSVWLGLIDTGYPTYVEAVRKAESEGKSVSSVTKWYYLFSTTTAYAK